MSEQPVDFDPQSKIIEGIYRETNDPAERVRRVTEANIIEPIRRNARALHIEEQRLVELEDLARRVADLEAQKVRELLQRGMVYRLDNLLQIIADEHPDESVDREILRRASTSIRSGIESSRKLVSGFAAGKSSTYDAELPKFLQDPNFNVTFVINDTDSELAEIVARRLGIIGYDSKLASLRTLKGWVQESGHNKGSIDNLDTVLSPDLMANVFERGNGKWDFYLSARGDVAKEMLTTPLPPSPFEKQD